MTIAQAATPMKRRSVAKEGTAQFRRNCAGRGNAFCRKALAHRAAIAEGPGPCRGGLIEGRFTRLAIPACEPATSGFRLGLRSGQVFHQQCLPAGATIFIDVPLPSVERTSIE